MIIKSSLFALFFAGAMYFSGYTQSVNDKEKEGVILNTVFSALDQLHFSPIAIDDEFSENAFDSYIDKLDGSKRFLIQSDIEKLEKYKKLIDDEVNAGSMEFFDLSVALIESGYKRAEQYYTELAADDFVLSTDKKLELDPEKLSFAESEAALKNKWQKMLSYEINMRVYNKTKEQNEDIEAQKTDTIEQVEELVIKSGEEILAESRESVKDLFDDWFKRLHKIRRSDRFENYLNTFANLFDPHTGYFNPKEKQDFDINMGGKLEGIGARLTMEDEYTRVASVVVGGPAWKGKQLEVDDLITMVTQKGKEPVDITGMRTDDVVQLIRGKKGTVVILKVKKKDGTFQDIEIERDEIIIDESFARSVILDLPNLKNIGYIKLPKFYSTFERDGGNSCAVDVAHEIEKLNAKNVNGVILDLRYNTGGSLPDVIDMSGLFIEDGPIVQVKPRDKKAYVYDDDDDKVQYSGPLMVLVNSMSASASEILTAALQDYDRALIVGNSNSTFGKGTVQRFFDLDRAYRGYNKYKPLGSIKVTLQKYYRVNGGSVQLRGVTPDIILPDKYALTKQGEKEYDTALPWTEIASVDFSQDVYKMPDINYLDLKSKARVGAKSVFAKISANAERVKRNREETKIPLVYNDYKEWMDNRLKGAEEFKDLFDGEIEGLVITNHAIDLEEMQIDSAKIERNTNWLERLHKDVYLEEALYIMKDMIDTDDQ